MALNMLGNEFDKDVRERLNKKFAIVQQNADADTALKTAEAGYYGGKNPTDLAMAKEQYGVGGSWDRHNLSTENIATQKTNMETPYYTGMGAHATAQAGFQDIANRTALALQPSSIESGIATNKLNKKWNIGAEADKATEFYNKGVARDLAMPQYNTPYTKTVPQNQLSTGQFGSDTLTDLWHGNLFGTAPSSLAFDKEKILRRKTDLLNSSFLANNPDYR